MDRIYVAALTPLKPNLSCDTKKLVTHCHDLLQRGIEGIVLMGTTGEGSSFSSKEKIKALRSLIKSGITPDKIIMGSSGGLGDAIELSKASIKAGCRQMLIAPPSFYKGVEDKGVIEFYREIVLACKEIQLLLYHIPQFTGVPISLNVIQALFGEFPRNVIGLKESEGNFDLVKQITSRVPGFDVYIGKEVNIIEGLRLGAKGTICGMANVAPELIASLFHLRENPPELLRLKEEVQKQFFVSAFKEMLGWKTVSPPLVS